MGSITTKHLAFLMPGIAMVSVKTYPIIFTKLGGRDTWIALIIACILTIIFTLYFLWVCKIKNCYSIVQIYKQTFGDVIGTILLLLFLITMILSIIESSSVESNAMHNSFLIYTPPWIFFLFSIICAIYIVKKKESLVSVAIISVVFISLSGILLAILTQKYKEYKYLFPIMAYGITNNFILCIIKLVGAYSCVNIILIYLDNITDHKKLIKHSLYGLLFVFQVQTVSMIGNITTFGINQLNHIIYPKLLQTQLINYFGFLEAGELFVMLQIVAGWFLKYILVLFSLLKLIDLMGFSNKINVYIISIIACASSYFVNKNILNLFHALNYLMYIQLINFLLIPLIVFTLFLIKKQKNVL